ncbi:MAG: HpcH/HpaI aldolase family protein [Nanobdellota archaeon]
MNNTFKFKKKIEDDFVLGMFMKTSDPSFVEIAGLAGFDFVILDAEHGVTNYQNMQNLIRAAEISNTFPIIRIPEINETNIGKSLDIGAKGIQAPQISTREDIKKLINLSKFYPEGERGVCRFVRAANHSLMDKNDYFKKSNETILIIQLEGQEALTNLDEIIQLRNIDVVFIGPYDLSQSLGVPGNIFDEKVITAMKTIVDKCKKSNKLVGTFVDCEKGLKLWKDAGVKYIAYSVDVGIFADACKKIINEKDLK